MRRLSPAEQLLQELGVTDPSDIDLEAIAYYRGASVQYRPLDGCEAHIIGYGERAVITVRSTTHGRRQRFSLAHELGHWCHHKGRTLICRPDDIENHARSGKSLEADADRYAADLLLPAYLFQPLAAQYRRLTMDAACDLAEAFNVSLTATAIRLVEIGPVPAMLVCHGPQGRRWFARGPEVPRHWFPRNDLDPDSYAFDVLFSNNRKSRPTLIGGGAWFDRRDADRFELYEHSVRISGEQVLTLLVFKDEAMLEESSWSSY